MRRFAILASACIAGLTMAQSKTISDQAAMDKLLASIPVNSLAMPHKTLLERFDSLGITATQVMFGTVSAEEVKIDPDHLKRGDALYQFLTSPPSERAKKECTFSSGFALLKRGGRWLVQDRTGNYLLQNKCALPN